MRTNYTPTGSGTDRLQSNIDVYFWLLKKIPMTNNKKLEAVADTTVADNGYRWMEC